MKLTTAFALGGLVFALSVQAHGPAPVPLTNVPTPLVPGLLDGSSPIIVNKAAAIALGKALFWDQAVGSDGQACASCHFHAGADARVTNQINPGTLSQYPTAPTFDTLASGGGGVNYTLSIRDFPTYQFSNPLDNTSNVISSTFDVVGSAGTFSGDFLSVSKFTGQSDSCNRSVSAIFNVGGVGARHVTNRNAPSVINAVFNYRNFWDGRANNVFNGSSPWGPRDPNAGVWVKTGARSVAKTRLNLINSSLASQAVAPPLNADEMTCNGRSWPDVGRKLLLRQPLQTQVVHNQDSVLGAYSVSAATGSLAPGLNTTYQTLITKAFNPNYWSYPSAGSFGSPAAGGTPYSQIEANFSMFFGLAIQMYESTLVSDQSLFDQSPLNPVTLAPTWQGLGLSASQVASLQNGYSQFTGNHCLLCHGGPTMSLAANATLATLLTPASGQTFGSVTPIAFGPNALGPNAAAAGIVPRLKIVERDYASQLSTPMLNDFGFENTGVNDPWADPGLAGVDAFGNPLSEAALYVRYLQGDSSGVALDPNISSVRACDFLTPLAVNENVTFSDPTTFYQADGIIPDGSREGVDKSQNCTINNLGALSAYIPTVASASDPNNAAKVATAAQGSFKIPTLRNVELTGPYMHNGSLATLDQVVQFYARQTNTFTYNQFESTDILAITQLAGSAQNRSDLVAFLKSLTDNRVRYEQAPFDHPQLYLLNGQVGNSQSMTAGNALNPALAQDQIMVIPAVGAGGNSQALQSFDTNLAP
jgi:cytochrome c peroxidase